MKNSLCVDVRLQTRVARKASLAISALERPGNQKYQDRLQRIRSSAIIQNLSSPDFQMNSLYVSCNKMSLVPALAAGLLFAWGNVYTPVFRGPKLFYILVPGIPFSGRGSSRCRRVGRTIPYRCLIVIVTCNRQQIAAGRRVGWRQSTTSTTCIVSAGVLFTLKTVQDTGTALPRLSASPFWLGTGSRERKG